MIHNHKHSRWGEQLATEMYIYGTEDIFTHFFHPGDPIRAVILAALITESCFLSLVLPD